jgi:hypothetical protein
MSRIEALSEVDKLVLEGQRWGLFDDPMGQALLRLYRADVLDSVTTGMIEGRIIRHRRGQLMSGTPFETPQLSTGDHIFGLGLNGQALRAFLQHRNGHALTVSGSGGGKTNKALYDAVQVIPNVRGSFMFDFRKRGFRGLRRFLRTFHIDQQILTVRDLKINPLQVPPGVDPRSYAPRIAEMLIDVLLLPPRASKQIQLVLMDLYRRLGVLDGSGNYPSLYDLRVAIADQEKANAPARDAILDSLDSVLSALGGVLAYRVGWATSDLARRHLVFELGGTTEMGKTLLVNALILPEFEGRIARNISNPRSDFWICCDEAQRLCGATRPGGGPGALSDLIGLVRGTGISLDLAVQSAHDISPFILSNTAIKVIGRAGNASDYAVMGAAMGLTSEQIQYCHFNLRPGTFVGQMGDGPWRYPFLFRVPLMDQLTAESQGDDDARDSTDIIAADGVWALPTVPAPALDTESAAGVADDPVTPPAVATSGGLEDAELRFLKAVIQAPGCPSSDYVKAAAIGTRKARAIRERLTSAGYLRVLPVATGKRGRNALVLEPTEKALQIYAATAGED